MGDDKDTLETLSRLQTLVCICFGAVRKMTFCDF